MIQFENELMTSDAEADDNLRRVQRICRLQGQAHSYFMFDNPDYKLARQIYYSLEEYELIVREANENEAAKDDEIKRF